MDKHFELNSGVHFVRFDDGFVEFLQRLRIFILNVDDKDDTSTFTEDHIRIEVRVEIVDLAGKVPDLKLNKAIVDVVLYDLVGRFQEYGVVRGHLMEHHFLDGTLPGPMKAHQEYPWFLIHVIHLRVLLIIAIIFKIDVSLILIILILEMTLNRW